jgi:hypothetical protein
MNKVTGHILKGTDVKLEGQVRLDTQNSAKKPSVAKNTQSVTSQAHIVETNPDFVVIQITCSCGTKTLIKCNHTDGQPANQMSKKS